MHGDAENVGGHARNRIQIFDRIIEWLALEQGLVDVRLRPAEQERVAVRPGACDGGSAYRTAAATHVFNHHRSEQGLHLIRPRATDSVECTTRWKRDNEPNRPRRISLRPRDARDGRKHGSARDQVQKLSTGKFHLTLSDASDCHFAGAYISCPFVRSRGNGGIRPNTLHKTISVTAT